LNQEIIFLYHIKFQILHDYLLPLLGAYASFYDKQARVQEQDKVYLGRSFL